MSEQVPSSPEAPEMPPTATHPSAPEAWGAPLELPLPLPLDLPLPLPLPLDLPLELGPEPGAVHLPAGTATLQTGDGVEPLPSAAKPAPFATDLLSGAILLPLDLPELAPPTGALEPALSRSPFSPDSPLNDAELPTLTPLMAATSPALAPTPVILAVAVPNLMDDLMTAALQTGPNPELPLDLPHLAAPSLEVAQVTGTEAPPQGLVINLQTSRLDLTAQVPRRPRSLARRGLALGVLGTVTLALLGTGAWLLRPRTTGQRATKPQPPVLAAAPQAARADAPTAPAAALAPPLPAPPALRPLRPDSVDGLDFASLRAGLAALPATGASGLRRWAQFRLAYTFADAAARAELLEMLRGAKPGRRADALELAAYQGALLLGGSRAQLLRAQAAPRGANGRAPQVRLVHLLAQERRRHAPPAQLIAQLGKLLTAAPEQLEAQLWRLQLLLQRRDRREALAAIARMPQREAPWVRVRVAELLYEAEAWGPLATQLAELAPAGLLSSLAPSQADALLRLAVRHQAVRGDVAAAAELATTRASLPQAGVAAWGEMVRLLQIESGASKAGLERALAALRGPARGELLAGLLRQAGQLEDTAALTQLQAAAADLSRDEAGGWLKLAAGDLALMRAEPTPARQAYQAATALQPGWAAPRLALELLTVAGGPKELSLLDKATRGGQRPDLALRLASLRLAHGDAAAAAQLLEGALWHDPSLDDPIRMHLRWLQLLDQSGGAAQAEAGAEALALLRPADDRPLSAMVAMARRGRRSESVVRGYRALLARHPGQRAASLALAEALIDAGHGNEAADLLAQLTRAEPAARDAEVIYLEARACLSQDPARARTLLLAAVRSRPEAKFYLTLAELEQGKGQLEEAVYALKEAQKLAPDDDAIQVRLARVSLQKGYVRDTITSLETLLMRSPAHAEAAEVLGDALREQGNNLAAVAAYRRALAVAPEQASLLLKVARLELQELGQVSQALESLRRAVKLDGKNPEAQYLLGFAMRDMGRPSEAKQALEHYLRLAPEGEFVHEAQQALDDLH